MDSIKTLINNICIFDFHHINSKDKEGNRDWLRKGFEQKIRDGKIELLCSNYQRMKCYK